MGRVPRYSACGRELGHALALGDGAPRASARRPARRVPHSCGAGNVVGHGSARWQQVLSLVCQTPRAVARSPAHAPASHSPLSRARPLHSTLSESVRNPLLLVLLLFVVLLLYEYNVVYVYLQYYITYI